MRKFCTMRAHNNFWSWREKMSSRSCRNPCKSLLQSTFFAFHWQNFFIFHFFKIIIISYHMCSWMHTKFLLQKSYWLNVCTAFCSMPLITHGGFACLLPHIILLWNNSAPLYSDTYIEDHSDFTIIPGSLQRQDWQDPRLPTCTEWKTLKIFPTSAAKETHLACAICLNQHQHDVLNSMSHSPGTSNIQQSPNVQRIRNFFSKKEIFPYVPIGNVSEAVPIPGMTANMFALDVGHQLMELRNALSAESLGNSHPIIQRLGTLSQSCWSHAYTWTYYLRTTNWIQSWSSTHYYYSTPP